MARYNNSKKYKKKKKAGVSSATTTRMTLAIVLVVIIIFAATQWNVFYRLEEAVATSKALPVATSSSAPISKSAFVAEKEASGSDSMTQKMDHGDIKFIIFHRIQDAQGAGNHMHGLLAAHLLGDEFERVVCVSNHYKNFHLAFESADPVAIEHCPDILERHNKEPPFTGRDQTIELLNYIHAPANECALKEMLSSRKRILHMTANTYPRWPRVPKHVNFFAFYKAKPILLDVLPYPHTEPPPIVVHLRKADREGKDSRLGVRDEDLRALGKLLPVDASQRSPFLVTNNVEWFDLFEQQYGWSHPFWSVVVHSELGFQWEARETEVPQSLNGDKLARQRKYASVRKELGVDTFESLQLWSDYYTLLRADKVYHTFSDFSLSAVHWMGTWSRTYDGLDKRTGKMILLEENWITDGESPRLADRAPDQLKNCDARVRIG